MEARAEKLTLTPTLTPNPTPNPNSDPNPAQARAEKLGHFERLKAPMAEVLAQANLTKAQVRHLLSSRALPLPLNPNA